ncbi:MAG: siderophore-interacting protein [Pseudomonadota bacterium]
MLRKIFSALGSVPFGPVTVKDIQRLTPNMMRVTLVGNLIKDYPDPSGGAHFKMIVPDKDQSAGEFGEFISKGSFKPAMRTYTIRHARQASGEIDVDIVVHGDLGRVGPWAQRTAPGEEIVISKPGKPKLITAGIQRILAAADMTGFPALAAGLETLSEDVVGTAFVEILSEDDRQPVDCPPNIELKWIIKPNPYAPGTEVVDAMILAPEPDASTSVFVAGEYSTVATLRRHFRKEHPVDKSRCYISSYWKAGLIEPEHQVVKAKAA